MRVVVRQTWIGLMVLVVGCAAKQQAATPPAPPSPSPVPAAAQVATAPEVQPGGALTPDEQRDALDRRLGDSLSTFDAMLLKEQKEVAEKRAEQQPTGGTGSGGEGASAGGRDKTEMGTGSGQTDDGDRSTGISRTGASSKRGGRPPVTAPEEAPPAGGSPVPRDVGDGRDDDVVARQIREAAMKERDPAIREKLWEEYRRYKGIRKGES